MRIGLDIDDCLADFWGAYCEFFKTNDNPKMLEDEVITRNVHRILRHNKDFWMNLKVINRPDFKPTLFCTKRVIPKSWTKEWLYYNGFPDDVPVYQMVYQQGNKANMIKGKVDVFIDDSLSNVLKCHASGVTALLMHTERTEDFPMYKVFSLCEDEIKDAYYFMKSYV